MWLPFYDGVSMMLSEFLALSISKLKVANIDNPALDARLLFCHALSLDRAQLLSQSARVLDAQETTLVDALIGRRAGHESVARIIGKREFWGLDFALNEATLEPRPDSETLIEAVLHRAAHRAGLRVLDLGTGTGCLLLALLHDLPTATGIGIDIAPRAVEQATVNAAALGLEQRAAFCTGHWLDGIMDKFDIIISNPPYIPAADISGLMQDVRDFDPMLALNGGADGLDPYRLLIPQLKNYLNPDGLVAFEVGQGQADDVAALLCQSGFNDISMHKDLGGIERCVCAGKAQDKSPSLRRIS